MAPDLRIFTEPQQGAAHADLLRVAQAAHTLGFTGFFRSDHVLTMGGDGLPGPSESFVSLGAIAAQVPDIRLGTLVTSATFRHPSMLAIAAAQVDDISGGRLELGLGSGWFEAEHTAYGLPFGSSFGERFDRLTEQLEIITGLWGTPVGETFDHDGPTWTLRGAPGLPKPIQRSRADVPHIPIIIGGRGPKRTPALAARFADEFNLGFPDEVEAGVAQFGRVRAACEAAGRSPDDLVYSLAHVLCVGADDAEYRRRAEAIGRDADDLRAASPLAGTVDEVVDGFGTWTTAGAQRFYLQVLDLHDVDHLDLVAREVRPRLDGAGQAPSTS
ncbi:LLM class F420-dependent oxidoreductase [Nakamurella flava]|uniref:LLM class F420-dependent oxidoreductase n=1 Tax=Nakamurella flava TaxID=2576308 RepID=A0A4U6QC73_9ACTN|nr:LLM class F420-dependent oxidoreductase [Nakamurella flava]TKV57643.1 LLM class F420-dependent oxidoreductase [Nakamurella flava]